MRFRVQQIPKFCFFVSFFFFIEFEEEDEKEEDWV
jgi:hypothetical protein